MMFASLELARPIAHGRMHAPTVAPVLSGVAVASAAWLDKPNGHAGYFVFPDLSVRHEGWYRLRFCLFEVTKFACDADAARPLEDLSQQPANGRIPRESEGAANRMEVSTNPFQVWSAKKFPGLDMSTEISSALADAGCRVRIRREIRQRKRETKPKSESSGRDNAEIRAAPEPSRTQSIDSQYQDMRRSSMASDYSRPGPSRQHSMASVSQISPMTTQMPQMSIPQMAMPQSMPQMMPPPARTWQTSPATQYPAEYSYPSTMSQIPQSHTLPPLQMPHDSMPKQIPQNTSYPARPTQYESTDFRPSKRQYSSDEYDQSSRLTMGYRPDNVPQQAYRPAMAGDHIEADVDNDEDDDEVGLEKSVGGMLRFRRSRAGRTFDWKPTGPSVPNVPRGMGDLMQDPYEGQRSQMQHHAGVEQQG
jgi:hypothetical protein